MDPACHVAVVPDVAVSWYPVTGAGAAKMATLPPRLARYPAVAALPATDCCHVAVVPLVAVRMYPLDGADAFDTLTLPPVVASVPR